MNETSASQDSANIQAHNLANILKNASNMEFVQLANFNQGHAGAFWSSDAGTSPWEMHPDTEELLMCLEGSVEIQILGDASGSGLLDDDLTKVLLGPGELVVVPKGLWHRHHAIEAFHEFYLTPGTSEHSMEADPRLAG